MTAFSSRGCTHANTQTNTEIHTNTPVVKVHDSLDGVPSSCCDVSLKARKQRGDHIHTVLFTLPVSKHTSVTLRHMKTTGVKL